MNMVDRLTGTHGTMASESDKDAHGHMGSPSCSRRWVLLAPFPSSHASISDGTISQVFIHSWRQMSSQQQYQYWQTNMHGNTDLKKMGSDSLTLPSRLTSDTSVLTWDRYMANSAGATATGRTSAGYLWCTSSALQNITKGRKYFHVLLLLTLC